MPGKALTAMDDSKKSAHGGKTGNGLLLSESVLPVELTPLPEYASIDRRYSAYKKIVSLATLIARGLPVLDGFVARVINKDVFRFLREWMHESRMEQLTLMFDSPHGSDKIPLTTNLTLEELRYVDSLLHDSLAVIIMEENDLLQQSYSVLTAFFEDHLTFEVVGPGFEASDLTRGHVSPHERIIVKKKDLFDDRYRDLAPADIIQRAVVSRDAYAHSVALRYSKIYHLMHRRLDQMVPRGALSEPLSERQRREVEALLEQHHSPLLLHQEAYKPTGFEKLRELYGHISELDLFYPEEVRGKVVSASFLKKHGLVFWGIFSGTTCVPSAAWAHPVQSE